MKQVCFHPNTNPHENQILRVPFDRSNLNVFRMKKTINNLILTIATIVLLSLTACSDLLETEPRSQISDQVALSDVAGIEATLVGIYSRMASVDYYGRDFAIVGELLSDQGKVSITGSRFRSHPINQEGAGFSLWSHNYNNINRANLILYYIDGIEADTDKVNQIKGEVYFLRALFYFDLLRVYARAPLYQSPLVDGAPLGVILKELPFLGFDQNTFGFRATINQGYDLVKSDLLKSIDHFANQRRDFPYRANKTAAKALLARLYLYTGDWVNARDMALEVIAEAPALANAADYNKVFTSSPGIESIFELFYTEADRQNTNNSIAGVAFTRPSDNAGYGEVILRQDLLNQFEIGDVRLGMTMPFIKSGEHVVYQYKFAGHKGQAYWDDVPVIRTSEVYLILAEAYWENQQFELARNTLNTLRGKRNLAALTSAEVSDADLIQAILKERRVELFFEHSHRWFDLRRRGMDIPKGVPGVDEGNLLENANYRVVDRITIGGEAEVNPNLKQNPGY